MRKQIPCRRGPLQAAAQGSGYKVNLEGTDPFKGTPFLSYHLLAKLSLYSFSLLCNKLPQTQWLKTMCIYYPTVSKGQESGQSPLGSHKAAVKTSVSFILTWRCDWGRICFQVPSGWQNSVPCDCTTEGSAACWLLAGDRPGGLERAHGALTRELLLDGCACH